MRKIAVIVAVSLLLILPAVTAYSEDGYNAQLFWPSIFGGNFIAIEDAQTLCPLGFDLGLYFNYANAPVAFSIEGSGNDDDLGVLNQLLTSNLFGGFGATSWMSLGLDVPVHFYARGRSFDDIEQADEPTSLENQLSMGDIRAEIKFRALRQELHWLGMAFAPYATFPTGDAELFVGEGRTTFGLNAILERDFKLVNLALNGGYYYRGDAQIADATVGDAWKLAAGISRGFENGISFSVEYWGAWMDSGSVDRVQANPMELMATFRYDFGQNLPRVVTGAGGGLTKGIGSPAYRLLAGVDYTWCKPAPKVGILQVNVVNQDNQSIDAKLEINGPEFSENPAVGSSGRWQAEVLANTYQVKASKPEHSSASGSGTVQPGQTTVVTLKLIEDAKTMLHVRVLDRCNGDPIPAKIEISGAGPDMSTDSNDGTFKKEWEPGNIQIKASNDEYEPKTEQALVKAKNDNVVEIKLYRKIKKAGKVYFAYNSDRILPKSYSVLDDVAEQIKRLCEFNRIIVEGHTSSEGSDAYNMRLSGKRAASVRQYLIGKGIDPAKLDSVPFGETRPIADNTTEAGKAMNRRVEFVIE